MTCLWKSLEIPENLLQQSKFKASFLGCLGTSASHSQGIFSWWNANNPFLCLGQSELPELILTTQWSRWCSFQWQNVVSFMEFKTNFRIIEKCLVVGRWSIIIESWSKSSSDATIDFAFFIIDCRRKIKNLLGTNKSSIKINKNVRFISCVSCLFSWTPNL